MTQTRYTIKLLATAAGVPTEHDGRYLVRYQPTRMDQRGDFEPGFVLVTTPDVAYAARYLSELDAWDTVRLQAGLRPDGKPNRPLTAWHVEIARI